MKRSDNIRCIREYTKKDGSISYRAEGRKKRAKPLRKTHKTLTCVLGKSLISNGKTLILKTGLLPWR